MLSSFRQLDRILRGEATRLPALRQGAIDVSVGGLSVTLAALGAFYGVCMGSFAVITRGGEAAQQMLASAVKVPLLFLLTLAVTFPSLYVFNALVGSRLSILSMLRLLVAAVAVIMAILASFGTIVAFFSFSTTSYPFMKLLNVAVFGLSGLLGVRFLHQTLQRLTVAGDFEPPPTVSPPVPPAPPADAGFADPGAAEMPPVAPPVPVVPLRPPGALDRLDDRPPRSEVRLVFRIWMVVFALVGAQMGWVLRPFIGDPNQPFTWFRPRTSNIFQAILDAIGQTFRG